MPRADTVGLFWDDTGVKRVREVVRPMPPIPRTQWRRITDWPDLSGAKVIGLDTETYDPNLLTSGPGWARNDGHVVGVSLATEDGCAWYLPMRHSVCPEENLDPAHVLAYLRDTLNDSRQTKIGANLLYDIGWLTREGVTVRGPLIDVQYAEALLNEAGKTSLDSLLRKYCDDKKETNELYAWCHAFYGGSEKDQRANIHRAPPSLVGPYAEQDARGPFAVFAQQWPQLCAEGLEGVFDMENRLTPLLVRMAMNGVRVDVKKAERVRDELAAKEKAEQETLRGILGFEVNVNSSDELAKAFTSLGLPFDRTAPSTRHPEGSPSFTQLFLDSVDHPVSEVIRSIRKYQKLRSTFVESYILQNHVRGRVHCQFHPLRGDENGTRSGRFSSSSPNLQNIPSRDKELAPLIRGLFLPDEKHPLFRRYDYSQIEYRMLVHHAIGPGSDEARNLYATNPDTDYHDFVIGMIAQTTGYKLDRKPAKNINFGLVYGMQKPKLVATLGLTREKGDELFTAYHAAVPFVESTMKATADEAEASGFITTITGRRSRFDLWEPMKLPKGETRPPALRLDAALHAYGAVRRAHLHKALNRRLQGGAADVMKRAMLAAFDAGVFDVVGVPLVTVHDELDFSDAGTPEYAEAFDELRHILETATPLAVPVRADCETGADWGSVA